MSLSQVETKVMRDHMHNLCFQKRLLPFTYAIHTSKRLIAGKYISIKSEENALKVGISAIIELFSIFIC